MGITNSSGAFHFYSIHLYSKQTNIILFDSRRLPYRTRSGMGSLTNSTTNAGNPSLRSANGRTKQMLISPLAKRILNELHQHTAIQMHPSPRHYLKISLTFQWILELLYTDVSTSMKGAYIEHTHLRSFLLYSLLSSFEPQYSLEASRLTCIRGS